MLGLNTTIIPNIWGCETWDQVYREAFPLRIYALNVGGLWFDYRWRARTDPRCVSLGSLRNFSEPFLGRGTGTYGFPLQRGFTGSIFDA